MLRKLVIIILLAFIGYHFFLGKPGTLDLSSVPPLNITYSNSLSIESPPIQNKLSDSTPVTNVDEYSITPLASFQVAARVLAAKHYSLDRESRLAPVDLALGWGPMARDDILKTLDISQSGRFYYWRTDNFVIPRREIETNSANMHFIPANPDVERKLKEVKIGDRIKFKGFLVRVDAKDGWRWISSLTREDTGGGACEVILVDDISPL